MDDEGQREARRRARILLHECGVNAPEHIRVRVFAKKRRARIVEGPLDGAKSQLVRNGDDITIHVGDHITDEGEWRLCVVHELGHLELRHPSCTPSELCVPFRSGGGVKRKREREAYAFGDEALMPERLVRPLCEVSPMTLDTSWRIKNDYRVSLLAASIRCAALASERCAAVLSQHGAVKWCAPSPTFGHAIERGYRLDRRSLAYDYFAKRKLDETPQAVPADAWLDVSPDVDIVEHATASDEHGTVLSMLWIPESSARSLGRAE